jgi:transposase InsO family protein
LYQKVKSCSKGCRLPDVRIKLNLFLLALKLGNVTEACARRGLSRQFYYRWWNRFERSGYRWQSLEERSRRPRRSPGKTCGKLEKAIRYYQNRRHGSRLTQAYLKRTLGQSPSRTTICHVMNGRKKVKRGKKARLKLHQKRYELPIPGQRLQLDVKYVPCLIDAKKTYTYVAIDECTRWRFARAYSSLDEGTTLLFLQALLEACPFPIACIQTDNGQEFTYRLNPLAGHLQHRMDAWCKAQGILHRLIPPGVKELNGKVERSHRIDMQYFYWRAPSHELGKFNQVLTDWIFRYNAHRPHGGIGFLTPWEKLQERLQTLASHAPFEDLVLERLRLNFLREAPRRLTNQDRQILALEKELQTLLKLAA